MAERDSTLPDRQSSTEILAEDEADSLLDSNCSRRDSNDLVTGDERRQSEDSLSKDITSYDTRTDSITDHILEGSPNVEEDQDEDAIGDKHEDDHEDILDVQAGVDATIDDQFEVLDSAGDTDNLEHLEEVRKATSEDEKRRSKAKHSTDREERSHDKKEVREPREKEPDNKGCVLRFVSNYCPLV